MASAKTRAPAGARRAVSAFFHELTAVPDARDAEVAKAAQRMIREALAAKRAKMNGAKPKLRHGPHVAHARRGPKLIRTVADDEPLSHADGED